MLRPLLPLGLGAIGLFVASQSTWGHLFRGSDGLVLAGVALGLVLPGLILSRILRVFFGEGPVREIGASTLAALLVYVPFWHWNQRGPIAGT